MEKQMEEAGVVDVLTTVYTQFAGGGGAAKIDVAKVSFYNTLILVFFFLFLLSLLSRFPFYPLSPLPPFSSISPLTPTCLLLLMKFHPCDR